MGVGLLFPGNQYQRVLSGVIIFPYHAAFVPKAIVLIYLG